MTEKKEECNDSPDQNIYILKRKTAFPKKLEYFCPAFPRRRGYLTVNVGGDSYEMFPIAPGRTYELIYPKSEEDGWVPTCAEQYIGPDLVMVTENCYTTYIKLF